MEFLVIEDTDIFAVNRGKRENESCNIVYRDKYSSMHEIDFHSCSLNFKAEHSSASDCCIGERKLDELCFVFYTSGIKTKVIFKKRFVFNIFRFHLFIGDKVSRFHALQKLIDETIYRTDDLS